MRIVVFTSSPNPDGLTAACGQAALEGGGEAGAEMILIDLNRLQLEHCRACGRGYGQCRTVHECVIADDFAATQAAVLAADAYVLISPVYWGEMSESAKVFFDRLRRCEASKTFDGGKSGLAGKPALGVAAAGGSGNGTINCLASMQLFFNHVQSSIFDLIPITQKSRAYKLTAIRAGVRAMAEAGR